MSLDTEMAEQLVKLNKENKVLKEQLAEKEDFIKTLGFKNEDKFREYVLNCLLNKEDKVNRIRELEQQQSEKDKEIKDLKEMNDWYAMWHNKFKKQIEELTTELETYRPTKFTGEGQTTCHRCKEINLTCFGFYHYKGQTLCDKCLKEVLKREEV